MKISKHFRPTEVCRHCGSKDIGFMPSGRHMDRLVEKCFSCDRKISDVPLDYDPGEFYYKDKQIKDYKLIFLKEELFRLKTRYHMMRKFLEGRMRYIWFDYKQVFQGDNPYEDDMRKIIFFMGEEIREISKWLNHKKFR